MLTTRFVDRETQLKELIKCFENSAKGLGNTVFITGETGIGKTALVERLKEVATRKGALFLAAECRSPVLAPYEPFTEAFSGIIESLLPSEEVTTVEEVFLISTAGLLLAHIPKKEALIDRDVVGGMLTAIQDFVAQSFREKGRGLEKLEYGRMTILFEHGVNVFVACVLAGKELPAVREDMTHALRNIEDQYGKILADWNGDISKIKGIEMNVKELIEKRYAPEFKDPSIIESKKLEIFETVLRTCLNLAQIRPLIIFLDRVELADESSLELLHYLARNIAQAKVMLCCTYRSEKLERNSKLLNTIHLIKKETSATELTLDHFDYDNLTTLIGTVFPKNNFPREFNEMLNEKAGGNPFFIQEILKALVADGIIYKEDGVWKLKDITALELPRTIREAVFYRVSGLDEESKEVLKYASVAGTKFEFSILEKALGYKEEKLADLLEKIIMLGLLKENEELKFDHGVTQESIYNEIPKFKRAIIHKKLGFATEELYSRELDKVAPILAYHFSEGKVYDKAYLYGITAGDKARKLFSLSEAIKYYELALKALKSMTANKPELLTVLNKLCEVSIIAGRWEDALKYMNELSSLSREFGEHSLRAFSYMRIGEIYSNKSQWDEAFEAYKLALEILKKLKDERGLAEIYRGFGLVHRRKGEYEKAVEYYKKSIEFAEKLDAKALVASLYVDLGLVYKVTGELELAIDYTKKSLAILEKLEELYELARTYNSLGTIYYEQENLDVALQYYEKCVTISKKIGFMRAYAYGLSNAGELYAKRGELEKARGYCNSALEIFEKLGEKYMIAKAYANYGNIYKFEKDIRKAQEYFEKSLKLFEELNVPFDLGVAYYEYALMYKERKDFARSNDYLRKALKCFEEVGAKRYIEKVRKELEELK
ncbi:MAG: tetratricopeptide repeat protein [Candidatus Thermoplasmatota archaeon]